MNDVEVSVIITVYNEKDLVSRAIESIIHQTFTQWELILVDDGSTDDTLSVLQSYASQDERIRCFALAHEGRKEALNFGIKVSTGKYVAICDADDYSLSRRLQAQVDFFKSHPEVSILGTAYVRQDLLRGEEYIRFYPTEDEEIRRGMATHIPICQGTVMILKEVYKTVGDYRADDIEDLEFYLRAAVKYKFANLPTPHYVYSLSPNHGFYHRSPHQWRRNLRLLVLCLTAIARLKLPKKLYLVAVLRVLYSFLPTRVKRLIRKRAKYISDESIDQETKTYLKEVECH